VSELKSFKFNDKNLKKAKLIVARYPKNKHHSAVMPLLELAQRQNDNWLSGEAIEYVAQELNMPTIRVYEVATFYTMYNLSPVGKFHIEICTNLPCLLRGSSSIVETCKKTLNIKIGETTEDKSFTLSEAECLGACVNAPMMKINDDYYEDLSNETTENIIDKLRTGKTIKTGSQQNRHTCEPIGGLTSLSKQNNLRKKILENL